MTTQSLSAKLLVPYRAGGRLDSTGRADVYEALFRPTAATGLTMEASSWISLRGSVRLGSATSRSCGRMANGSSAADGGWRRASEVRCWQCCRRRSARPRRSSIASPTNMSCGTISTPHGRRGRLRLRDDGRTALLLEDPAGEPLARLIAGPMEAGRFLRLAIGMVAALGRAHQHGLVHKDVKPAHILVNCATGRCGSPGSASPRVCRANGRRPSRPKSSPEHSPIWPRADRAHEPLDRLAQRPLCARRHLLSDADRPLPFSASDPMEWVHCHIARKPCRRGAGGKRPGRGLRDRHEAPRQDCRGTLPDRSGLEHDLRRCLAEWEAQRRIEPFALGERGQARAAHDPREAVWPGARGRGPACRLRSRGRERRAGTGSGLRIFRHRQILGRQRAAQGARAAARAFRGGQVRPVQARHSLCDAGAGLSEPGAAPAQQERSRDRRAGATQFWRRWAERPAYGRPRSRIELIIGEQPPVPQLEPQDAQRRFHLVFRRFIGVFARPEHPLALFLDDLQWLDAATLDLLGGSLDQADLQHSC